MAMECFQLSEKWRKIAQIVTVAILLFSLVFLCYIQFWPRLKPDINWFNSVNSTSKIIS